MNLETLLHHVMWEIKPRDEKNAFHVKHNKTGLQY